MAKRTGMSRKQMLKDLKPTKKELKMFLKHLKAHGLTPEIVQQNRLDAKAEG